jgi:uncharacterized protein (DUF362 family)/Pyruvate/2-oxoacid:ferredoxin oxidoreductase delta subunit
VVSLVKCSSYDSKEVDDAIRGALDSLGGIAAFVSSGERILIKPNMLAARHPDKAITTHPEVVRATIRLVKAAGGSPVVGDSPAGPSTERILRHLADKTGIAGVCIQEDVPFVLFTEYTTVAFDEGKVAKTFDLTKTLQEMDGVISLAKLKTHSFTRYTGAVKNLFGLVHGLKKAEYHMRMRTPEAFSEMLVDLAECVRPRLTIMDAVVGMDGDGPSAGRPRDIGALLASSDPHALDVVALEIVDADPKSIWTVRSAMARGLLPEEGVAGIDIRGEESEKLKVPGFSMPPKLKVFGGIPGVLGGFVAEGIARKPVFSKSLCTACAKCVDICPANALSLRKDALPKVHIRRHGCIRCYCCHEVCPEDAVTLRRRPLRSWGAAVSGRRRRRRAKDERIRSGVKE